MSAGPLNTHWPNSAAGWALLVSFASFGVSALTFFFAELRRWERISIKVNFRYRIDYQRDRYLYPTVVEYQNLRTGDRCCRLTIKYRGRHSAALQAAYFEIACSGLYPFNPGMAPCTLYDGQSKRLLLAERMFDIADVTGFAISTESHGVRFRPVRHFQRFQHHNLTGNYRLFRVLQAMTGVPHIARASDMNPKRCPSCRASRRFIKTIDDQLVPANPGEHLHHRSRRFECGKCSHQWWADSVEPERIPPSPNPSEPSSEPPASK